MLRAWCLANRGLLAVLVVALAARGAAIARYHHLLAEDRDLYRTIAGQIVAGRGFSRPFLWRPAILPQADGHSPKASAALVPEPDGLPACFLEPGIQVPAARRIDEPTAYRPPLYPLLLCLVWQLRWIGLGDIQQNVIGLHLLLGLATVAATVAAGRQLGLGSRAEFAGLVVALDPLLLIHAPQVMTETLAAALSAVWLAAATGADSTRRRLAVGGLLGLACLCRPTFLVTLGLWVSADILFRARIERAVWRRATVVLLSAILVLLPWGVRNRLVLGHWVFTTTHGGYTLYLGHNPAYTRLVLTGGDEGAAAYGRWISSDGQWMAPVVAARDLANDRIAEFEFQLDRHYGWRAADYIRAEPATAFRSGVSLWRRMWSLAPTHAEGATLPVRRAIGLFYGMIFFLSLLGLAQVVWGRRDGWLPAVVLLVSFATVHFVYWADMRMRAPLTPAIALLAAQGTVSWFGSRRT